MNMDYMNHNHTTECEKVNVSIWLIFTFID